MKKFLYAEHSWPELREATKEERIVVLPLGTIEEHGYHLPLETDSFLAYSIAKKAAERIPDYVLLMPPIYYGWSEEVMDFPGTITINPINLINYVQDVCMSIIKHGFKKIILLNGHGGNTHPFSLAAREITFKTGAYCVAVSYFDLAREACKEIVTHGSHACEFETSLMLALKPQSVDMTKASEDMEAAHGGAPPDDKWIWLNLLKPSRIRFHGSLSTFSKTGVIGDPTKASGEKGEKMMKVIVDELVAFIKTFRKREISPRVDHH